MKFIFNFKRFYQELKNQNKFLVNHLISIVIYGFIYYIYVKKYGTKIEKENFSELLDCIYFSCVTHFTVGFGDISPKSKTMKLLTMSQILIAFILMSK